MSVSSGPGGKGTKVVRTSWPVEEGLELGTSKLEGKRPYLKPQGIHGVKSRVASKDRCGI